MVRKGIPFLREQKGTVDLTAVPEGTDIAYNNNAEFKYPIVPAFVIVLAIEVLVGLLLEGVWPRKPNLARSASAQRATRA